MPNISKHFPHKTLSLAILAAISANTAAQSNNNVIEEEVLITGIRGSLIQSMDVKRESSGVVDAISAEDIGKFPDTNLAESLQRITGVSIDRSNNEGNQVTVRGFGPSFNLVTLNGRQMPNSSALESDGVTRSFNFREIAAESVNGVEIYKTGKADISSGGIGSTININTAKPFDFDGSQAAGSIKGIVDTSVEKGSTITPEISGLVSVEDGRLGLLLAVSHSERDSRKDRVGTAGWVRNRANADKSLIDTTKNPTQTHWTPWTADVDNWDYQRERLNVQVVAQAALTDSLTATLDYTGSRFKENIEMNRMSFWFDDPTGDADANGTMWNPRDPEDELNFWAWDFFFETHNDSAGLNLEWQANDSLSFTFDHHNSTSHSQPSGDTSETLEIGRAHV